jgi:hypothetical protein
MVIIHPADLGLNHAQAGVPSSIKLATSMPDSGPPDPTISRFRERPGNQGVTLRAQ